MSSLSSQTTRAHDHRRCVRQALADAASICRNQGARLTPLRQRVLELVWQSHDAIKAYDILHKMGTKHRSVQPPTVYRALDFLMQHGLVHKIQSLNAYIGCPNPEQGHECQLLICNRCGLVEEFEKPDINKAIRAEAKKHQFRVKSRTVEVHGVCKNCQPG